MSDLIRRSKCIVYVLTPVAMDQRFSQRLDDAFEMWPCKGQCRLKLSMNGGTFAFELLRRKGAPCSAAELAGQLAATARESAASQIREAANATRRENIRCEKERKTLAQQRTRDRARERTEARKAEAARDTAERERLRIRKRHKAVAAAATKRQLLAAKRQAAAEKRAALVLAQGRRYKPPPESKDAQQPTKRSVRVAMQEIHTRTPCTDAVLPRPSVEQSKRQKEHLNRPFWDWTMEQVTDNVVLYVDAAMRNHGFGFFTVSPDLDDPKITEASKMQGALLPRSQVDVHGAISSSA